MLGSLIVSGLGSVFTYMVALNTNVINFSSKHTGKVVGFLNACFAGSPSIFATIYYNIFTTGDSTNPENQDFQGFMLFFAILFGVVNLLCMAFLRIYTDSVKANANVAITHYKDNNGIVLDGLTIAVNGEAKFTDTRDEISKHDVVETDLGKDSEPMSLKQLICSLDFHMFVWMFAFASCVGLVYVTNLTVTSKSVALDYYNNKLVLVIPITNAVVSATIGILSDMFKTRVPRLSIVTVSCVSFGIGQVLVVIFADKLTLLIVATACNGVGVGIIWSLCPTIMKEKFSVEHLGRNWGIALLLSALLAFASQAIFGVLYDAQVPEVEGINTCYGIKCIQAGYAVFLGFATVAFGLGTSMLIRQRCCHGD